MDDGYANIHRGLLLLAMGLGGCSVVSCQCILPPESKHQHHCPRVVPQTDTTVNEASLRSVFSDKSGYLAKKIVFFVIAVSNDATDHAILL